VSMLLGGGFGNGSMRLIAVAQLASLASDLAFSFTPPNLLANPLVLHLPIVGSLMVFGLSAAASLHPDFLTLGVAPEEARPDHPWLRTPLLWFAVAAGPALLLLEAWRYDLRVPDAVVIAAGCIAVFGLVIARMQLLVRRVNAQSVVLAEHAGQLRILASHDGLTGLINRRTWDSILVERLQRAAQHREPVTMAILDLDHFKRYNDTLGHQAGDRLLKAATAAWSAQLRAVDVLGRYGGEEFVALLGGADATEAVQTLRRLHDVTPDEQTFSAGVATWDGRESADALLARADAALYVAKRAGRNRSIIADTGSAPQMRAAESATTEAT
jgi:diguanylate cyclase